MACVRASGARRAAGPGGSPYPQRPYLDPQHVSSEQQRTPKPQRGHNDKVPAQPRHFSAMADRAAWVQQALQSAKLVVFSKTY